MIDAYTIGITLALEDGVSEGIVAIRRDLAQLDVAVAESAARLNMLRKLTADVGLSMPASQAVHSGPLFGSPAPHQQAAPSPRVSMETPTIAPTGGEPAAPLIATPIQNVQPPITALRAAILQPVDTPFAAPRPLPPAMPTPLAPPATPSPSARQAPTVQVVLPEAAAPTPPKAVSQEGPAFASSKDSFRELDFATIARSLAPPSSGQPTTSPRQVEPVAKPPPASVVVMPSTINAPILPPAMSPPPPTKAHVVTVPERSPPLTNAPIVTSPAQPPQSTKAPDAASIILPRRAVNPPIVAPPLASPPHAPKVGSPPPEPTPRPVTPMPMSPPPPSRHSVDRPVIAEATLPTIKSHSVPPAPSPPIAPPAVMQRDAAPPSLGKTETATPLVATASTALQQADPPASAELHLDGAALGRWVTRHLERQVTRPQAGATGFDPRMSPTWAGAPIGN